MKDSRLLQWGRLLLAVVIFFFLSKRLAGLLTGMEGETVAFHPLWLIASLALLISYRTLLVYPWRRLYRAASRMDVSFLSGWTLFQLSQLGKYLPGKVGHFASLIVLCRPLELSKTATVVSTLQGLFFQCLLGFGIGIPVLLSQEENQYFLRNWGAILLKNTPRLIGFVLVIIATACVFLILFWKGQFLKKKEFFRSMGTIFSVSRSLRLLAVYFLLWSYFGIAFFLFIKSIYPVQRHHFLLLTSIYPFAWSIGFLSFITPGGLGVREAVLSVLLTQCLPSATATMVALFSRGWVMSAEIVLASIAGSYYYQQKHKKRKEV